jgi:hypothetical protein
MKFGRQTSLNNMKPVNLIISALTAMALVNQFNVHADTLFGDDLAFLRKYTDVVLLSDKSGQSQVAVVPACKAG